jgi:hypothetical protein
MVIHMSCSSDIFMNTINGNLQSVTVNGSGPRGLRRGSMTARLLGLRVRNPPGAWMSVFCECCVLSGTGLCVGLITRPEDSYRVWLSESDREASIMRPWTTRGCCARGREGCSDRH